MRTEKIDWLGVAVSQIGGIAKTAKLVGRSEKTIRRWLKEGLLDARLKDLLVIAGRSQVLISSLVARRRPPA